MQKKKGVGRKKLFTVTQNYICGKTREKQILKAPAAFGTNWEGEEAVLIYIVKSSFLNREREVYLRTENPVFFIAMLFLLPVVLEFPLEGKTNNNTANHRD